MHITNVPDWTWGALLGCAFFAGFLAMTGQDFIPTFGDEAERVYVNATVASTSDEAVEETGETVYNRICVGCHQANGQGLSGAIPPLAGSSWVTQDEETPIRIVLLGLNGQVDVNGTSYNGVMNAWGGVLNDEQIAMVLTYVRSEWGNEAAEVSAESVAAVREVVGDRTTALNGEEELNALRGTGAAQGDTGEEAAVEEAAASGDAVPAAEAVEAPQPVEAAAE